MNQNRYTKPDEVKTMANILLALQEPAQIVESSFFAVKHKCGKHLLRIIWAQQMRASPSVKSRWVVYKMMMNLQRLWIKHLI